MIEAGKIRLLVWITIAMLVILPLAGGLVGYKLKDCPTMDQFKYDSLSYANGQLSQKAEYYESMFTALRKEDSIRQAEREPIVTTYKRHEKALTSATLDSLQRLYESAPTD
jgi:hypothetical protein